MSPRTRFICEGGTARWYVEMSQGGVFDCGTGRHVGYLNGKDIYDLRGHRVFYYDDEWRLCGNPRYHGAPTGKVPRE